MISGSQRESDVVKTSSSERMDARYPGDPGGPMLVRASVPSAADGGTSLARILEQSPDPVLWLAPDGCVVYLNGSARAAFGNAIQVGARAFPALLDAAYAAMGTGSQHETDIEHEGRGYWAKATAGLDGAVVFLREVTGRGGTAAAQWERKSLGKGPGVEVETGIRESEGRDWSWLNNLRSTLVYQVEAREDGARRFTYVSNAVLEMFGCTPEEAIADANRVYGTVAGGDRERWLEAERRCGEAFVPFKMEMRLRTRAGEDRRVRVDAAPRRHGDGSVVWDGLVVDMTEGKRREDAVGGGKASCRGILDSTGCGFCVIEVMFDDGGRPVDYCFQEVKAGQEAQTGREGGVEVTVRSILAGGEQDCMARYGRVALSGEPLRWEGYAGEVDRWFDIHAYRVGEPQERKVAVLFSDITAGKRAEMRSSRHNAVLSGVARILRETLTCRKEEELGRVCLAVAQEVTQSNFGYIEEVNPRTGVVDTIAVSHAGGEPYWREDPCEQGKRAPAGFRMEGQDGAASREERRLLSRARPTEADCAGGPAGHAPLIPFLGVPLTQAGKTIGLMGLGDCEGGYGSEELEAIEALAPVIVQAFLSKRAEKALRDSEERFRSVLENSRDGIYCTNLKTGQYEYLSPAAEEILGFKADDPASGDIEVSLLRIHPDDVQLVGDAMAQSEATGEAQAEYRHRTRSGEYRWMSNRMSVVRDASGQPCRRHGNLRDITEHKRAEEALRASEERYRTLFQNMAEGFFVAEILADEQGTPDNYRFLDVNAAFERLTGLARGEVIGRTVREVLPEVEDAWIETYGRVAQTGEPSQVEVYVSRLGRHFSTVAYSPCRKLFACLFQDVTERNVAAQERECLLADVQAQRSLLDAVIENLPVGIGIAEAPSGRLIRINEQTRRIWRLDTRGADDATGYAEYLGLHPDGRRSAAEDWQLVRALRGEVIKGEELEFIGGDGTHGFMRTNAAPVMDRNGKVVAAVVVIDDVTERKQAEENLRAANLRLAEVDRRKNEFLAVLSHELRNPLAPIKNSLYILDRAAAGGDQARRAQAVIDRQVKQLAHLVDDLLDVTRISRNKVQLQRQRLELTELVTRTLEDHASLFEHSEVELRLAPASGPVFVYADWNRIAQVVGNLLSNAAKFTGRGGQVSVSVTEESEAGRAVIRVADTGLGIAPEVFDRLFQPFMQADTTLDRSKGGLGLGLALVKGLVDLHGGEILASSAGVGKGAEFIVRLPLDHAAAQPISPRPGGGSGKRHRVLIVEDNYDAAQSLREVLELNHHEVRVAHSGADGLATAQKFLPDVVLCDIGLPGMNGYDVARAFKTDERLQRCYLVALSGYALPEDLQRATDAGFQKHLAKPPSIGALHALLEEVGQP